MSYLVHLVQHSHHDEKWGRTVAAFSDKYEAADFAEKLEDAIPEGSSQSFWCQTFVIDDPSMGGGIFLTARNAPSDSTGESEGASVPR
jgi:hypothetical protein